MPPREAAGPVSLSDICECAGDNAPRRLPALRALLRRGAPPVPPDAPITYTSCPIQAVLTFFRATVDVEMEQMCERFRDMDCFDDLEEGQMQEAYEKVVAVVKGAIHDEFLERMEVLVEAGYCPRGDPADYTTLYEKCATAPAYRWLWLAAQHTPWSPDCNADFPPAFRAAVRTLVLAARRHKGLGGLPQDVLHRVLAAEAYPLSAWGPLPVQYWSGY